MSSSQLAKLIGVSASWISRVASHAGVAHETKSPDAEALLNFARACKVDIVWLITGEGSPRGGSSATHPMTPFDVGAAAARLDGATAADVEKARADLGAKNVTWQAARDRVMFHCAARERGLPERPIDPSEAIRIVSDALKGMASAPSSSSTPKVPAKKRRR